MFPMWLGEGIAYVVAGQDLIRPEVREDIRECYDFEDWKTKHKYAASGNFTRYLIDKYGKEKVIRLLREVEPFEEKAIFSKKFKNIYQKDLDKIVEEWLR